MKKELTGFLCLFLMILLAACCQKDPDAVVINVTTPLEVDEAVLNDVSIALSEGMTRKVVSNIQHDLILNEQQVGGIVLVDIPKELLDSPREGLFDITERVRQQVMPDVPAKEADIIAWGGSPNAYMELAMGPEEITYFHYIFRGTEYTYDVWFDWNLLEQDSDTIYEIVKSVSGEDILPENNKNPF